MLRTHRALAARLKNSISGAQRRFLSGPSELSSGAVLRSRPELSSPPPPATASLEEERAEGGLFPFPRIEGQRVALRCVESGDVDLSAWACWCCVPRRC